MNATVVAESDEKMVVSEGKHNTKKNNNNRQQRREVRLDMKSFFFPTL